MSEAKTMLQKNTALLEAGFKLFCDTIAAEYPLGSRVRFKHARTDVICEVIRVPDPQDNEPWHMLLKNVETGGKRWVDVRYSHPERLGK